MKRTESEKLKGMSEVKISRDFYNRLLAGLKQLEADLSTMKRDFVRKGEEDDSKYKL